MTKQSQRDNFEHGTQSLKVDNGQFECLSKSAVIEDALELSRQRKVRGRSRQG